MEKMGFLSLVAVLCCAHLAYGEIHSLKYVYTTTSGIQTFPEFVTVLLVDGQPASYYDSNIRRETPRQDWMKNAFDADFWDGETQKSIGTEQVYKANIEVAKQRFNQTGGVHIVQYMYGCQWDDETLAKDGFDQFAYDGEDFLTLDLKNQRYVPIAQQSQITTNRWNSGGQLAGQAHYLREICIEWLQKYVQYGRSTLGRKVAPEVSLAPKGSGVACHATGFYPEAVMITWKRGTVEMEDDVDVGETLPNEDGTFQKRAVLTVSPEERKNAQYSCEVTHKSRAEPINKILIEAELNRNGNEDSGMGMIIGIVAVVIAVIVAVIAVIVWKKRNGEKKEYDKASSQDTNSDISNPNPIVRTAETEELHPSV